MNNIFKIQEQLDKFGIDGLLIAGESNRRYAVGFHSTAGIALICRKKAYFYTDSRYIEAAGNSIKNAEVVEVGGASGYIKLLGEAIRGNGINKLGFEEQSLTWGEFSSYEKAFSGIEFVPASALMSKLRASKEQEELDLMIKAQRIAERALEDVLKLISADMTEKDVAAELTYKMLKYGGEGNSFDPIVVSGTKSSMPHGVPDNVKLTTGSFITMDFGCKYEGYCSDMTRTVALGSVTEEMKNVYDVVLRAQQTGIYAAKAGISGRNIDKAARDVIDSAGYGEYFGHSFGHSLGLDIHEKPNASPAELEILPENGVISAEPGIYIPGRFGVRIEDVLILKSDGCIDITKAPRRLIIL